MTATPAAASRIGAVLGAWRRPHAQRSMGQRMMVSTVLGTVEFGVEGVTRLISTIILTRILSPEDFGAYAVVLFILYLLVMVTDLGIRSIVLTREGEVDADFLRCCWTIQLIRGGLLALAVVAIGLGLSSLQAAGMVAGDSSYANADLPWVICAAAAVLLIKSAESPKAFVYERDMRFMRVSASRIGTTVAGAILTIALVWWLESLWALVLGQIAATAMQVCASFLLFRGPAMRLRLGGEASDAILTRGKWIMSHSGLTAVTELADRIMFSVFFSAADFGVYYIGRQIISLLSNYFSRINGRFSLQYFTHLQNKFDYKGVSREYYKYRLGFDMLTAMTAGLLFACAPLIVAFVYDDRYTGVAHVVQLLSLGLPLVGVGFIRAAFSAQRRFRAMTLLSAIQASSIWLGLVVALPVLGSTELAIAVVAFHRLPELGVLLWRGRREGWVRLSRELRVAPLFALGAALGWAATLGWTALGDFGLGG